MPDNTANTPNWFVQGAYLNNKAKECSLINFGGRHDWTNQEVLAAIQAAGQTPYSNFVNYGNANNVSPSPFFVVPEYLASKAAALNKIPYMGGTGWDGNSGWTIQQVQDAFTRAGLSAWDHYTLYGQFEDGVNPANNFDQSSFWEAKVKELNAWENDDETKGFAGKDDWTVEDVQNYFRDHGLNAIMNLPDNPVEEQANLIKPVPDAEKVDPGNWEPWGNHVWPIAPVLTSVAMASGKSPYNLGVGDTNLYGTWTGSNSGSTFQDTDQIDGGPGNDAVTLSMSGDFKEFKDGGFIRNVEQMILNNDTAKGGKALTFNAQDVTGVKSWTLNSANGAFTLQNLQDDGQTFVLNNVQGDTTTNLQFAGPAISGTDDAISLALNTVGNPAIRAGTSQTPAKFATVVASGIETMNVVPSSGDNYLDLGGTQSNIINLNVGGSAPMHLRNVGTSVVNFDASTAKGNIDANLVGSSLGNIKGGSGDDDISINGVRLNPVFDGGSGDDTLTFYGGGSFAPTMSGFETLSIINTNDGGNVGIDAARISGLNTLQVYNTDVTMSNLDGVTSPFTVANRGGATNVRLNGGNFDLNYQAYDPEGNNTQAPYGVAGNLTSNTTGDVTISESGNATLGGGTFNLYNTDSVTINNTNQTSDYWPGISVINAPKATKFEVSTTGNLGLGDGTSGNQSNLSNVSDVKLYSNGASDSVLQIDSSIGNSVNGGIAMDISGMGSVSLIGQIGSSNTNVVNVNAGRSSGDIYNGINGQETPSAINIVAKTLYYTGAWGDDNIMATVSGTGTVINGRGGDDIINLYLNNSQDTTLTPMATINTGVGTDTINISNNGKKSIVQITDWSKGDTLNIAGLNSTVIADASDAKDILQNFGYTYASQLQGDKILVGDTALKDGSFTVTAGGDLNGTYFVNNADPDQATILVKLVGVDTQAEFDQGTVSALNTGGSSGAVGG